MSMQQVNLYQDELKKQKLNYSAMVLLQLSLILIMVFSAVSGFKYFQLQQDQARLIENQHKQKTLQTALKKIQTELSLRQKNATLAGQIVKKSKELTNKQKVLGILSQDEFGNTEGFIEHITGLARQRTEGLWLTQIRIAEGGANIALFGTTVKPSLLPKYLQRLSFEKAFTGTEFQSLLMERQAKKKQWMNFSLQTKNYK